MMTWSRESRDAMTPADWQAYEEDAILPWFQEEARAAADAGAKEADPGFVQSALGWLKETGRGVTHGAIRAGDEMLQTIGDLGFATGVLKKMEKDPVTGAPIGEVDEPVLQDTGLSKAAEAFVDAPTTLWGNGVAGVTQFVAAYGSVGTAAAKVAAKGVTKGITKGVQAVTKEAAWDAPEIAKQAGRGASTVADVGKGLVAGGVADAVAFDPHEARLSTMLNEVPWLEPFVSDYLASANPDDPAWEGRLKNVIEGGALGVTAEVLMKALRRVRARRDQGQPERADRSPESEALKDQARTNAVDEAVELQEKHAANVAARVEEVENARRELDEMSPASPQAFFEKLEVPEEAPAPVRLAVDAQTMEGLPPMVREMAHVAAESGVALDEAPLRRMGETVEGLERRNPEALKTAVTPKQIREATPEVRAFVLDRARAGRFVTQSMLRKAETELQYKETRPEREKRAAEIEEELKTLDPEDARRGALEAELEPLTAPEELPRVEQRIEEMESEMSALAPRGGDIMDEGEFLGDEDAYESIMKEQRIKVLKEDIAIEREREKALRKALGLKDRAPREVQDELVEEAHEAPPKPQDAASVSDAVARMEMEGDRYRGMDASSLRIHVRSDADFVRGVAEASGALEAPDVARLSMDVDKRLAELNNFQGDPDRLARVIDTQDRFRRAVAAQARNRIDPNLSMEELRESARTRAIARATSTEPDPLFSVHRDAAGVKVLARTVSQSRSEAFGEMSPTFGNHEAIARLAPNDADRIEQADRDLYKTRVELQGSVPVADSHSVGSTWSNKRQDQPVHISMDGIESTGDFDLAVRQVAQETRGQTGGNKKEALRTLSTIARDTTPWRVEETVALRPNVDVPEDMAVATLDTVHAMGNSVREMAKLAVAENATISMRVSAFTGAMKLAAFQLRVSGHTRKAADVLASARQYRDMVDDTLRGMTLPDEIKALDSKETTRGDYLRAKREWEHKQINEWGSLDVSAHLESIARTNRLDEVLTYASKVRREHMTRTEKAMTGMGRYIKRPARELWLNSVLSSPATHMRNIIGNAMVPMLQVPEHFLASYSTNVKQHGRREALNRATIEAKAAMNGYFGGLSDAVFLMKQDWRTSMAQMRLHGDAKDARLRELAEATRERGWGAQHAEFIREVKLDDVKGMKALGIPGARAQWQSGGGVTQGLALMDRGIRQTLNAPLAALQAEDMFFKALTYRMEMHRRATLAGLDQGHKGESLREFVMTRLKDPELNDPLAMEKGELRMASMKQAHLNTFTNDLGEMGQATLDVLNTIPGARYVVPFFKTPTNILSMAGSYVPLLHRAPGFRRIYEAENNALKQGGRAAQQVIARQQMGMALIAAMVPLAFAGKITGGETPNPQFRSTARRLGRPSYSVNIGGTWYDYRRWTGPYGLILGAAADITTLAEAMTTDPEVDNLAIIARSVGSAIGSTVDDSWLGNISDVYESIAGEYSGAARERLLVSLTRGFVPLSAATDDVRAFNDLMQGGAQRREHRQTGGLGGGDETAWEQLGEAVRTAFKQSMSAWSVIGDEGTKYPQLDIYGEPQTAYQGESTMLRAFNQALSPVAFIEERTDPLSKQILELQVPIDRPKRTLMVTGPAGTGRTLEMEPDEYQFFAKRRGQLFRQYGTAAVKRRRYTDAPSDEVRSEHITIALEKATRRARKEMFAKFPDLERRRLETRWALRRKVAGSG